LSAFRLNADVTVSAQITPGAAPALLGQALAEPVTITGEGPVNGDALSFDFDAAVQGLPPLQGNLTKVGDELFVGVLGTDYRVDLPRKSVASVVPGRLATGLLSWATTPKETGRETVDGVATAHLTATVDTAQVLDDIVPLLQTFQRSPLPPAARRQLAAALATKTFDLWIGADDLLPRRISVKLDYTGGVKAVPALRSASLSLDVRLSALGDAVTITAPQTTKVLDLARLSALASR
jgi:hypothetical protein